jgi:hypothetical protein
MGLTLVDHPARARQVQCHPLHTASSDAVTLLDWLPHFRKGPYLFSTTFGEKPVNGFSKAKARLDEFMLEELGPGPGDQPTELAPFAIHDLRRTVRTPLSSLRVPDIVAEMVIGLADAGWRASTISIGLWTRCAKLLSCGPRGCALSWCRRDM